MTQEIPITETTHPLSGWPATVAEASALAATDPEPAVFIPEENAQPVQEVPEVEDAPVMPPQGAMIVPKYALGEVVHYARVHEDKTVEKGYGIVTAAMLSPFGFDLYRVTVTPDKSFNIEAPAINATPEQLQAYIAHRLKIEEFSDQQNAAIATTHKQLVEAANAQVETWQAEFLGTPIKI